MISENGVIVEPDDRQVVGYVHADVLDGAQCSDGHQVVGDEHGGRGSGRASNCIIAW